VFLENIEIKEPTVLIISKTQKYYFHQRTGKKEQWFSGWFYQNFWFKRE
jgi:hypothetical protein